MYLDSSNTYDQVTRDLERLWPKLNAQGILAGHDFTKAHPGVRRAVMRFAVDRGLKLYLTDVQTLRKDVEGRDIPSCCPSWYFVKQAKARQDGGGGVDGAAIPVELAVPDVNSGIGRV